LQRIGKKKVLILLPNLGNGYFTKFLPKKKGGPFLPKIRGLEVFGPRRVFNPLKRGLKEEGLKIWGIFNFLVDFFGDPKKGRRAPI